MKIIIYFRKKMLIVIIKNRERIDEFKINLLQVKSNKRKKKHTSIYIFKNSSHIEFNALKCKQIDNKKIHISVYTYTYYKSI